MRTLSFPFSRVFPGCKRAAAGHGIKRIAQSSNLVVGADVGLQQQMAGEKFFIIAGSCCSGELRRSSKRGH
jgi:hypothetical protein